MASHPQKKLVRCLLAAGIVSAAPWAQAQQTQKVEKVEVTGTRIQAPELEGASPVAVIRAEDIRLEGVRNVESLLNNMPQVLAEFGMADSNGATGTATVNLRGLGSVRTLVLVNGRRLPPGSPIGIWAPDLNAIPAALVRRIDILTGGASAVYGSDAVAGVVNFIMNDNFEGAQGEVNYSFHNHEQQNPKGVADLVRSRAATNPAQYRVPGDITSDAEVLDVSLILGGNFAGGKGNATVFFGYNDTKPLLQSERDYSACALNISAGNAICQGSGTSYPGQFILNGGAGPARTVANAQGGVRPYVGTTDAYNFGPLNYYQRPVERYVFDAFAHYDVAPNARVYSEFGFHDNHTVAQIAPSGLFGNFIATVQGDNPLLSSAWRAAMGLTSSAASTHDLIILRRNVEGGGRQADLRNTSYRGVLGVKGDVAQYWSYDLYGNLGRVVYQQIFRNDFSVTRLARSLDVIPDPATGAAACRSAVDGSDPACVPWNIWTLGGVDQAALDYVQLPLFQKGYTSSSTVGATMSADLGDYGIRFPGAKSGVGVAFGFERRVDELQREVDAGFASGDGAGQGGPTAGVEGQISVKDFFVEGRMPILERAEWAHLLSISGSYRRSDYSTDKKTNSYGVGIEWAPTRQVRLRGSYQQAVRAPNVFELFTPQTLGLYNNDADPCAGATPSATLAQCQRTGVTAAQYGTILDNPAGQYNAIFGGNPGLDAETAKTQTLGAVFEPMRNLSASIDYYRIRIDDVISTLNPTTTLDNCLATGNATFCSLITRDSIGTLWLLPQARILATNINIAKWETSGLDVSVNYTHKLDPYGGLNLNFIGSYLEEFKQQDQPGDPVYDCAGYFGLTCGVNTVGVMPEWKHKFRATWSTPWNVDLAATWRYIGEVTNERLSSSPLLAGTAADFDRTMKAMNYIDLAGVWRINKTYTVTAGINNLFDQDPPVVTQQAAGPPFGNGNTFPNMYDAQGRKIFVTFSARF
jgi:outer membrane receptor protein involved in Fe transport